MIDLLLDLYFKQPSINYIADKSSVISCNSILHTPVVCRKRKEVDKRTGQVRYYIKLTGETAEFLVNRCTYLGNSINKGFVFIKDTGKWCKIEI